MTGVTGEAIASNILDQLTKWQLQPQLLRGQAYDGAGSMAGKINGVAACIASLHPKAVYTHCASHRLNLCIVKCCSIREINNMMQTADGIARFFKYSPKRQLALEKWIDSIPVDHEKQKKLKEMCRTRWVEHHESFQIFIELFVPIISCLEDIAQDSNHEWNRDSCSDAQSYFLAMSQFSFIFLVLTQNVLGYTKGLSVKLQGPYTDVARAYSA